MSKLPYKGKALIDDAVMNNQEAIYDLVTVLKTAGLSDAELFRRIGIVIDRLHQVSMTLKTIPVECKEMEEKKDAPAVESQSAKTEN